MVHAVESNFSDYIQTNAYPWELRNTIRKCTEITAYRRLTEWLYLPKRTVYMLRSLGKILFVIALPI